MGFRKGAYATVWEVKPGNGRYSDVRISISKKKRDTEEYVTEFSGYVRFVGDAHDAIQAYGERARIKIGECDVTNKYDKEKKVTFYNCAVFSFEDADGNSSSAPAGTDMGDGFMSVPDNIEDELPFC